MTAEDFLYLRGISTDTTIGIEGDYNIVDLLNEYASQQRTEGIREGFEAARKGGIIKRNYSGFGSVSVYGQLYDTVEDYLNSK